MSAAALVILMQINSLPVTRQQLQQCTGGDHTLSKHVNSYNSVQRETIRYPNTSTITTVYRGRPYVIQTRQQLQQCTEGDHTLSKVLQYTQNDWSKQLDRALKVFCNSQQELTVEAGSL